jgi:NAD(P)-dependent dehydrogenase (short-subunit alcohol dehydrogenase family)
LNIRANSIHPGYIWTPMVESYLAEHGDVSETGDREMSINAPSLFIRPHGQVSSWN